MQQVLDELGAGEKPRLIAYNKADLVTAAAGGRNGSNGGGGEALASVAPSVGGAVFVSALTGFGLDTLRLELSALLASLWEEIDVLLPYTEGELLARVRERGTIEIDYRDRDVRIRGKVAPALAAELRGRNVDGKAESAL